MVPSLGAMLGSVHSSDVLDRLNMASGGGVIFGQPGDPLKDRYKYLRETLSSNLALADQIVEQTRQVILEPDRLSPITNVEALYDVPKAMRLPILMFEPVRTLLQEGRINGYDIDPDNLPDEDVYGRLINNGKVDISSGATEMVWEWKSDDPALSEEDLEAIEKTRGWIDSWLMNEMRPGGEYRDPTDPSNKISKKKRK
jgi:hypothetical protein